MTTRPWKQYSASWFLLAGYFPGRAVSEFVSRLTAQGQAAVACCMAVVVIAELANVGVADPSDPTNIPRATQDRLIEYVCREVPPNGYVAAGFPLNPIFRRDTFFKVVIDRTEADTDGFEQFMPLLTAPPYSEHFQTAGYAKEMEIRPPLLLVLRSFWTSEQAKASEGYLRAHLDSYEYRRIPDTSVIVLQKRSAGNQGYGY
jgi:hypothetical protein